MQLAKRLAATLLAVAICSSASAQEPTLLIELEGLGERPAELSTVEKPYATLLSENLTALLSTFTNARTCQHAMVRSIAFADVSDVDQMTQQLSQGGGRVCNERLFADMCGAQYMPNYYVLVRPGQAHSVVTGAPGETRASPLLQRDVQPNIHRVARVLAECPEPNRIGLAHTIVNQAPPEGGGAWQETWVVSACGRRVEIPVRFQPSPRGGIDYAINGEGARVQ
jgi:hypothetical protein